jgi:hypothetical protein
MICLYAQVEYKSDAMDAQMKIFDKDGKAIDRNSQLATIKKMKADLTVTNFKLGDEKPQYVSVSTQSSNDALRLAKTIDVAAGEKAFVYTLIGGSSM